MTEISESSGGNWLVCVFCTRSTVMRHVGKTPWASQLMELMLALLLFLVFGNGIPLYIFISNIYPHS